MRDLVAGRPAQIEQALCELVSQLPYAGVNPDTASADADAAVTDAINRMKSATADPGNDEPPAAAEPAACTKQYDRACNQVFGQLWDERVRDPPAVLPLSDGPVSEPLPASGKNSAELANYVSDVFEGVLYPYYHPNSFVEPDQLEVIYAQAYHGSSLPLSPGRHDKEVWPLDTESTEYKALLEEWQLRDLNGGCNNNIDQCYNNPCFGDEPDAAVRDRELAEVGHALLALNPDVPLQLAAADGSELRNAYLRDGVQAVDVACHVQFLWLPRYIYAVAAGTAPMPWDGRMLCDALHTRGINLRYLGRLVRLAEAAAAPQANSNATANLVRLRALALTEIVVRAAKHVLRTTLCALPYQLAAPTVVEFFNILFGLREAAPPVTREMRAKYRGLTLAIDGNPADPYFAEYARRLTAAHVFAEVRREAGSRFRLDLGEQWWQVYHEPLASSGLQVFRQLSLAFGLQWRADTKIFQLRGVRRYSSKNKRDPLLPVLQLDDLVNIAPVVVPLEHNCRAANETLHAGVAAAAHGQFASATQLLNESLTAHTLVYGAVHARTARVQTQLALANFALSGNNSPGAIDQALVQMASAASLMERLYGVDSPEAVLAYASLGACETAAGTRPMAAAITQRHALLTLLRYYLPAPAPLLRDMFINIGLAHRQYGHYLRAAAWFRTAVWRTGSEPVGPAERAQLLALVAECEFAAGRMAATHANVVEPVAGAAARTGRQRGLVYLERLNPQQLLDRVRVTRGAESGVVFGLDDNCYYYLDEGSEPGNNHRPPRRTKVSVTTAQGVMDSQSIDGMMAYINGPAAAIPSSQTITKSVVVNPGRTNKNKKRK
ncbi:hypothetical protein D0Z00_004389 [Geotrichum galactomycetum]|uniref:Uncharacterized protein n=1 Tax=Geotrichum galactomycetum TaxID=27317 RepID=A0ACB6UYI6_9ASCO|nr:hypothetical protein D0Z00_004389 [Geotrichum candidum]